MFAVPAVVVMADVAEPSRSFLLPNWVVAAMLLIEERADDIWVWSACRSVVSKTPVFDAWTASWRMEVMRLSTWFKADSAVLIMLEASLELLVAWVKPEI